ncbi:MAG: glycosyltransferase, partial [Candidatus Omnitrophica bacterium]|nr:glycosyltransferase [Candidatus Omnitrophota bacterium]
YAYAMAGYERVDIIHDHTLSRPVVDIPVMHTLHGPATEGSIKRCVELSEETESHFVSISNRQQKLYHTLNSHINFAGTVYNSVNVKKIEWSKNKEDFFLFVGRSNWEKGLDLAIRVATKAHVPLVMAVKMSEDFEQEFFKKEIQPWIDRYPKHLPFQFHGEIPRPLLFDLFKRAKCTLFTSQWEEPFGLVMIESMACGTPVIALHRGAVPEVIVDGKTGFVVDTEEEMVKITKDVDKIRPEDCRRHVENNFSRERMTKEYTFLYKNILAREKDTVGTTKK